MQYSNAMMVLVYKWIAKSISLACGLWILFFPLFGASTQGKKWFSDLAKQLFFQDSKLGVILLQLAFPVLIAGTVSLLLAPHRTIPYNYGSSSIENPTTTAATRQRQRRLASSFPSWIHRCYQHCIIFSKNISSSNGDGNWDLWAALVLFLPMTIYLFSSFYRQLHGHDLDQSKLLKDIGNSFGKVAIITTSILLLPVAQQDPIGNLWGWSPMNTIRFHIWAGWIFIAGSVLHGGLHMLRWKRALGENVMSMIFPPRECWNSSKSDESCYNYFRNFTGFWAVVMLLVITLTSLSFVRRNYYIWFYNCHIVAAPLGMLLTLLHYNTAILYFAPSFLYYVASSFPVWVESRTKCTMSNHQNTTPIVAAKYISSKSSRPCLSLTLRASEAALERYRPGMYVKLSVPQISHKSHPFSINKVPGKPQELRIILRVLGPFTKQLATLASISTDGGKLPLLARVNGFYGSPNRVAQVLGHDVAILVAAGIGITPYLTLLNDLASILAAVDEADEEDRPSSKLAAVGANTTIVLHWICRDAQLIDHVRREYLEPLVLQYTDTAHSSSAGKSSGGDGFAGRSATSRIQILIHRTGSEVGVIGTSPGHYLGGATDRISSSLSYSDEPAQQPKGGNDNNDDDDDNDDETTVHSNGWNITEPPFLPLEAQQDLFLQSSDTTGAVFSPSRFASGSRPRMTGNLVPFLAFSTIAWLGLWMICSLYTNVQHKHQVTERAYAPFLVVLLGFVVAVIVNAIPYNCVAVALDPFQNSSNRHYEGKWWNRVVTSSLAVVEEDDDPTLSLHEKNELASLSGIEMADMERRPKNSTVEVAEEDGLERGPLVSLRQLNGRPPVHELLKYTRDAVRPGLFCCVPSELSKEIHNAANETCTKCLSDCIKLRQCMPCSTPRIAIIYDEAFYL
jgi:predicted ferric reductase